MRTRYRQVLDRQLSYPIGLKDIQEVLSGSTHADELEVTFLRSHGSSDTGFRQRIARNERSPVLRGRFTKYDKGPSLGDDSWLSEYRRGKWEVSVFPVARSQRAVAHKALLASGLPALAEWLECKRSESWFHGRKILEIAFDPIEGRIYSDERIEAV